MRKGRTELLANYIILEIILGSNQNIQARISKQLHKALSPENTVLYKKFRFPRASVVELRLWKHKEDWETLMGQRGNSLLPQRENPHLMNLEGIWSCPPREIRWGGSGDIIHINLHKALAH